MTKFFAIIFLLVSVSASGNVLTDSTFETRRQKHFVGLSFGLTKTKLSGSEIDLMLVDRGSYQESKIGFDIALVYKFELTNFVYLKSGLGLTSKRSYMYKTGFRNPMQAELKFFNVPLIIGLQPINARNSKRINLALESGVAANMDQGSDENTGPGLHQDNVVERKSFVPAVVLGGNLEVRASEKLTVFMNFWHSKDLTDYYNRTYKWYDYDKNEYEYYNYNYRIASNHLTLGVLFVPNNL